MIHCFLPAKCPSSYPVNSVKSDEGNVAKCKWAISRQSPVHLVKTWTEDCACRWQWPASASQGIHRPRPCCDVSPGSHGWLSAQPCARQAHWGLTSCPTTASATTTTTNQQWWSWLVGVWRPLSAQIWLYQRQKVRGEDLSHWRKTSDILTSTLATFLFSSHPKKERDREAHLNYYASSYNSRRQLSYCNTKLNQLQQNSVINLN